MPGPQVLPRTATELQPVQRLSSSHHISLQPDTATRAQAGLCARLPVLLYLHTFPAKNKTIHRVTEQLRLEETSRDGLLQALLRASVRVWVTNCTPVHACLAMVCMCVHVSISPPAALCLGLQLSAQHRQAEKFCNLKELLLQTSVLPLKAHERQASCEQPKSSSGRQTSFYAPPAFSCDACDLLHSPGCQGLKGCYCTGGCERLRGLACLGRGLACVRELLETRAAHPAPWGEQPCTTASPKDLVCGDVGRKSSRVLAPQHCPDTSSPCPGLLQGPAVAAPVSSAAGEGRAVHPAWGRTACPIPPPCQAGTKPDMDHPLAGQTSPETYRGLCQVSSLRV